MDANDADRSNYGDPRSELMADASAFFEKRKRGSQIRGLSQSSVRVTLR
jgi:hypothetical protein